jgi:parallel beta-helix repeat protein
MVTGLWLLAVARAFAGNYYAGVSPAHVPWPGGVVPFVFTNSLTTAQQMTYLDGLREWELAAQVQFVPRTTQTHWILFTYNSNGFDNVSSSTNPQVVSVASLSRAQVCHEMGHSFGFTHENIRPDATNFIAVQTNNIANAASNIYWFTVDPTSVTNGNYDFESVMHLGWDFDSTTPGVLATQQPKPPYFPRYQFRLGNFCLSPGDRAALAYLYGPPAAPLTNIVTTTADAGPGSLRAAIYYATDHPGTTIRFNIATNDPGYSNGVFNLQLTGMLPPLVANGTVIDGSTQPGFANQPVIILDGSQILPETFTSDTFLIYAANNQIRNLSFSGFNWNGLTLEYADATNNTLSGCWFGLGDTGTNSVPNAYQGIYLGGGASRNIIGGATAQARNVISGNAQYGVYLTGPGTTGNQISGNYIGTDFSGSNAVPNGKSGIILLNGAGGSYIGGIAGLLTRNVISGNSEYGIDLENTASNVVLGNYIGLNAGGSTSLGNTLAGVGVLAGAQNNLIGGPGAGARNVISGNAQYGILLNGANDNTLQGNFIGPDYSGIAAPASDNSYGGIGVWGGAAGNLIGGAGPAGNLISGNNSYGIFFEDPGTSGNRLEGNLIGTDVTGTNALGNWFAGAALWNGATSNLIGSPIVGTGNTIAFNGWAGLALYDASTTNNSIRGNSIFGNSGLGIDLNNDGVTTNHAGSLAGPNDLQDFPVITNATTGPGTMVRGSFNSLPNQNYFLDFYSSRTADSSGYGEGEFYLGGIAVTTDASGKAGFTFTNAVFNEAGQYISATATSAGGDTSEFSADLIAVVGPSAQFTGPYQLRTNGFAFSLTVQTNFNYRIQAATNLVLPVVWTDLTNFIATNSPFLFTDHSATNYRVRFYRAVSP